MFEDKGLEFFLSTMEESRGLVYLRENGGVVNFITRKEVVVMKIGCIIYVVAAVALQAQFGACEELLPNRADWLAPVRA